MSRQRSQTIEAAAARNVVQRAGRIITAGDASLIEAFDEVDRLTDNDGLVDRVALAAWAKTEAAAAQDDPGYTPRDSLEPGAVAASPADRRARFYIEIANGLRELHGPPV